MNYDNIGEFIKMKRKEKNLTQKDLASKIGVTDKAVSKWETGLGCPDVSILEILSKELDCSILELLKGREIENEVIKVTEADDYIKESIKYGENNIKKTMSKIIAFIVVFVVIILFILNIIIIAFIVVFVVIILFILNIINIVNQRRKYIYVQDSVMTNISERIQTINKNIDIIKNNKGKFSKEDYEVIITSLDHAKESVESNKYINYRVGDVLTNADLYIMDTSGFCYTDILAILRILTKYDSSLEHATNRIIESIGTRMMLGGQMSEEPLDLTYRYQFAFKSNISMNELMVTNGRFYDMYYRLGLYIDATNYVIEVGDINE